MITTRWGRARTWTVASVALATGVGLAISAGPAGAVAPRTTISATYSCSALGQTFTSPISLTATVPATALPNAKVTLKGFTSKVTIPESLVASAESYGVTWISASGFTWDLKATHAVHSTVNIGKTFSIPQTNLPTNPPAAVTVTLPTTGTKSGTWTADATAGTMKFTDGTLKFTLNDNLGITAAVSCTPAPAATLGSTKVS